MRNHCAYSTRYYAGQWKRSRESATAVVPLVLAMTQARSVVDVGCGTGSWLAVFRENGVHDLLGIDGEYVDRMMLQIDPAQFMAADLGEPLDTGRTFDLVVSLEVAEHITAERARTFVESLTSLGPIILFSAAIPFQGGTEHVNEQWPEYWAELFASHGYVVADALRRDIWSNRRIEWCYRQNALFFVDARVIASFPLLHAAAQSTRADQLSLVHPDLYSLHHTSLSIKDLLRKLRRALVARARGRCAGTPPPRGPWLA